MADDQLHPEQPAENSTAAAPQPLPVAGSGMSLHALRYSKTMPEVPQTQPPPNPPETTAPATPDFPRKRAESSSVIYLKTLGIFVFTFGLVYAGLAGPALAQRLLYTLQKPTEPKELVFLPKLQDEPIQLVNVKNRPEEYLNPTIQIPGYSLADLSENHLLIPKIKVKAPIIWNSEADEATMLASLEQGVAHYDFTARPDEGRGNVFITGHSSYFFWAKGSYKTVFANLDRLETGDQIAVTYQGIVYLYEVKAKEVVKPTDFRVTENTELPTLSLMTCVPVGTSLNRLVVTASLVSASPTRPLRIPPPSLTDPAAIFHYLPI